LSFEFWEEWRKNVWRAIDRLSTGDPKSLRDVLAHIVRGIDSIVNYLIILENINNKVNKITYLEAKLERVEAAITDLGSAVEELSEKIGELEESLGSTNRMIARIDMNIGGLTEAVLARFFVEELERSGARCTREKA